MDVEKELAELRAGQNILAAFVGQALAALCVPDPVLMGTLDALITRFDGMVARDGSRRVMACVRDGADKMLSAARRQPPGGESDLP
jgi:hypothetical protein